MGDNISLVTRELIIQSPANMCCPLFPSSFLSFPSLSRACSRFMSSSHTQTATLMSVPIVSCICSSDHCLYLYMHVYVYMYLYTCQYPYLYLYQFLYFACIKNASASHTLRTLLEIVRFVSGKSVAK